MSDAITKRVVLYYRNILHCDPVSTSTNGCLLLVLSVIYFQIITVVAFQTTDVAMHSIALFRETW